MAGKSIDDKTLWTVEEVTPEKVTDLLVKRNDYDYNITKSVEELSELSTILLQKLNKPNRVDDQKIIDEIGDVYIRLSVLGKMFGTKKVERRITKKLKKYANYIKQGKLGTKFRGI
jgi:NTP pyrophosphatase (non-canonical NTP hydrolase)